MHETVWLGGKEEVQLTNTLWNWSCYLSDTTELSADTKTFPCKTIQTMLEKNISKTTAYLSPNNYVRHFNILKAEIDIMEYLLIDICT